ncbi:MAG: GNAT family N-acetyltransferase [Actinomycetota bacterium]|nr:GNAT family N-acetyltransferase [Actinomycetota bacterium]MDQ3681263.1 GNAT family N-acetyltransferase [Actinomycetota bacterium]
MARLAELCRQAQAELGSQERGGAVFVAREARPEPVEDSLLSAILEPDRTVMLGMIDDTVMGYATGRTEGLRDGSTLGVIDDLFVEEEARAVGVGEAMMDALLAWFRAQGCSGVDSLALPGARATKNFFEESGFTARLLVMHHRMTSG